MGKRLQVSLIVVFAFYLTGLIGLMGPHPGFFIRNTPLNLLVTTFFLLLNHPTWNRRQVILLIFLAIAGYLVEVIGVHTGLLFGDYKYGKTLGIQVFGVPLLIGINWMIQIYIAGNLLEQMPVKNWIKASLGSLLLVFFDLFLEPVAIHLDYWKWNATEVPFTNYLCWFIISYLFLSLFFKIGFRNYNPLTLVLYFLQLMMFMVLAAGI